MKPANVELLSGRDIGISQSYYKPAEYQLLADYLNAVPSLTISEENKLRKEIETLTIEKSRLDRIEEKMLKMEQMYQK